MPFTKPWPEACLLCIVHSDGAVALCGDDTVEQQDELCTFRRSPANLYPRLLLPPCEGVLVSAASGEASATAQSEFAEMITLSVKYRVETVQRNAKMHERSEKG